MLSDHGDGEHRDLRQAHDTFGSGTEEGALKDSFALQVQDDHIHTPALCELKDPTERFPFKHERFNFHA
jgi:hypothetical protein